MTAGGGPGPESCRVRRVSGSVEHVGWAGIRLPGGSRSALVRGWGGGPAAILAPRETRGWGGGALSCACSAFVPPVLRAGVTSHLGKPPRRGAGPYRGPGVGDPALALPAEVHSPRPWRLGPAWVRWDCTQRQVLPVRACHCFPIALCGLVG